MSVKFYTCNQKYPVLVYRKEHWNRITLRTGTASAGALCSGTVSGWERKGRFGIATDFAADWRQIVWKFNSHICQLSMILLWFWQRFLPPHRAPCNLLIPCCLSRTVVFKISGKWQRIVTMLLGLKRKLRDAKLRSDTQARAASICVWHVQHSTAQHSSAQLRLSMMMRRLTYT